MPPFRRQIWQWLPWESNLSESQGLTNSTSAGKQASRVSLFLMTNSFETGGSERQFAVMARSLPPQRFQISLGCIRRLGVFARDFGDVPEFWLGGSLFGWTSMRIRLRLARVLRRRQVHIAHAFDFYTNLTLIPAARLARVPVVIGSQRQLGDLLTPRQFRAQAVAFRWCDGVVCNSKAAADRLAAEGISQDKLFVIGNALPETAFAPAQESVARTPGRLRVGMVARMNAHYKNHAGFLRIAATIHRELPDAEFLLVGDGPLRSEIERQAQDLGLANHVFLLGDRRDIPGVLASMDVAVLTSHSESLSNVILEAMAAGLPVVAYRVGGNAELVNEERGVLIPAGDEEGFAAALLRLLSSSRMRSQLGQNGRKFAQENFSLERILDRYTACYQSLLEKKGLRNSLATWRTAEQMQEKS
jgi:glycosyltransferase involved in cell wall biosynthesis